MCQSSCLSSTAYSSSGIRSHVARKFHTSFAASKQHQPFLLRFRRVINPYTANTKKKATTHNLATVKAYYWWCGRFNARNSTQTQTFHTHNLREPSLFIWQTGLYGTVLLRTLQYILRQPVLTVYVQRLQKRQTSSGKRYGNYYSTCNHIVLIIFNYRKTKPIKRYRRSFSWLRNRNNDCLL